MDVIISLEAHFLVTPDGRGWAQAEYDTSFWNRYLEVFDNVTLLARAKPVPYPPDGWHAITTDRVRLHPIPDYTGPGEYFRRVHTVSKAIRGAILKRSAIIMRVPSQIATSAAATLGDHPYGLEVVGDPIDVYTYRALRKRMAFAYRWWFTHNLRSQCRRASGVAYVTRHALQKRYPASHLSLSLSDVHLPEDALCPKPKVFWTNYSSIQMEDSDLVSRPRIMSEPVRNLVIVASLARMHKGVDLLIAALDNCRRDGFPLRLTVVGDGVCRPILEQLVAQHKLNGQVTFLGQVPVGESVRRLLDKSDLFVLPSYHEGLPRAMLEAMARGLPCIGSAVGGVPEILPPEDMIPPGNVAALTEKIKEVVSDSARLENMSARNLSTAREYRSSVLSERRCRFYSHIRAQTESWLRQTA